MVALRAPGKPGQPLRMPVMSVITRPAQLRYVPSSSPISAIRSLAKDHDHTRMPSVYHTRSSERGQACRAQAAHRAGWRFLDPEVAVAVLAAEPARDRGEPRPPAAL